MQYNKNYLNGTQEKKPSFMANGQVAAANAQEKKTAARAASSSEWRHWLENLLVSSSTFVPAVTIVIYVLYALVVVGVSAVAPELLKFLDSFLRIFVCLFLLIRFNPFRDEKSTTYTKADRTIVFNATLLLLSSQGLTNAAEYVLANLKYSYAKLSTYV
jgi:hypothetical protein